MQLEKVTKTFHGPKGPRGTAICALDGLDLRIEHGEFLTLLGPSGCGKSTTLRVIAGLEQVSQGSILIDGEVVNDLPAKDRDVAMVLQTQALYPHLTVNANLALGLKLRKVARADMQERIVAVTKWLGLGPLLERFPAQLSVGERQRVALARALARRAGVFLFDEPLSSLDAPLRMEFRDEMAQLHQRFGLTMLHVTHDQEEAMTLGNRIAVMKTGRIQQIGRPLEVYRQPQNLFVAGFVGSPPMNLLRGTLVRNGSALRFQERSSAERMTNNRISLSLELDDVAAKKVTGHIDREIVLGLRAEALQLRPGTGVGAAAPGQATFTFTAEVVRLEPLGADCRVYLRSASHRLCARVAAGESFRVGEQLTMTAAIGEAHFFDPTSERAILSPAPCS